MLLNSGTLKELGMMGAHMVHILSYNVDYSDPQKSWVSFVDNGTNVTVNRALLQLKVPGGAKLSLTGPGGAPSDVIDARMLLEFGVDGTLCVALDAYSELRVIKVLSDVAGPSLLVKALSGLGVSDATLARLTVLETLTIVLASDGAVVETLSDCLSLPLTALAGFTHLRPDWRTSTAEYLSWASTTMFRLWDKSLTELEYMSLTTMPTGDENLWRSDGECTARRLRWDCWSLLTSRFVAIWELQDQKIKYYIA